MVKSARADSVQINWKPFSLAQINQKNGDDYKVWEEPAENLPPGIWGLRAGLAAQRQAVDLFDRFLPLLLRARHEDRRDLGDKEMLKSVAQEAGIDVGRFMIDLEDPSTLQEVAQSHTEAVNKHGVFGTPTFVFSNGASSYLKILKPENTDQALRSFDILMELMESEGFVGEVKRPQPPWPKGAFANK